MKLYPHKFGHFIFHAPQAGRVAVLLSGGLDSCVMALMLLECGIKPTLVSIPARAHQNRLVTVRKYLASFGLNQTMELEHDINEHNIRPTIMSVADTGLFDVIYVGVTKNPPHLENHVWAPKRPDPIPFPAEEFELGETKFHSPFRSVTKDTVFRLADLLGVDTLQTYSCTENAETECGACFACIERKWAFEEFLNFPDGR